MLNSKKRKREEKEDVISRLPDSILHHVLSFLPTNDATKTGALSKSWNATWQSFPFLDFDQSAFSGGRHPNTDKPHVLRFCRHVQSSLKKFRAHNGDSIQKFWASVNFQAFRQADTKYLNRWLAFAMKRNVRDLVIDFLSKASNPEEGWRYVLPPSLFSTRSSLQSLELLGCQFVENNMSGLSNLKKLSLVHVYIDQDTFQVLLSNHCRHLEELSIYSCKGFEAVRVSDSPRLEVVDFFFGRGPGNVQVVSVCSAPNLRSVSCAGSFDSVKGSVLGSDYYGSVEELRFHDMDVTDEFFRSVIPRFRQIRRLEIEMCYFEESVRISSDQLSELVMHESFMVKRIELDARCLTRFETDGGFDVHYVQ